MFFPRNAEFKHITKILGSNGRQVLVPANIGVSSGSNINTWTDMSGNGFDMSTPGGSPQRVTGQGGYFAAQFSGTTDSLTCTSNWATIRNGSTKFWNVMVLKLLAGGGGQSAEGNYYINSGAAGDTAQYINWCNFSTRSGVDYFGAEIWVDGATARLAECTTNPTGSTTRSWMIVETWITSGNVLHVRCQDGSGTSSGTRSGCTSIGSNNLCIMGASGGAAQNCVIGYQHIYNASPDPVAQAYVRKYLGRAFGMKW